MLIPPSRATAVKRSAELLVKHKDEDAGEVLTKAINGDPNYGPLHNNMGIVHLRQGRLYDAAREFDLAARLMPTIAEPRNNLGMVLERVGRFEEAIASYTKAHDLQPDNPIYLGNLLRAKVRHGDNDPEMGKLFEQLLLYEARPDWIRWAKDQKLQLDLRTRQLPGQSGPVVVAADRSHHGSLMLRPAGHRHVVQRPARPPAYCRARQSGA